MPGNPIENIWAIGLTMNTSDTPADNWARTIIDLPLSPGPLRDLTLERQELAGTNNLELAQDMFKVRLANSEGRRESADLLIKKMYAWRGYRTSEALSDTPNRITLMADLKGQIIGTLTLGLDSSTGLLADQLYKDEIDALRQARRFVCEFTKLAIDRDSHSQRVLAALFHLAYIYAHKLHDATDFVIEVNPRHAVFYKRMLGFTQLGEERQCPRVNAPAILLRLTSEYVVENTTKYGGEMRELADVCTLYPFAFSPADEAGITQRLMRGD